jgi:GNAT superfamily N-acetyltransferase
MISTHQHITRLEELSLNAWPSPRRVILDGWVLQFTGGFTGRANSVHPLYTGTTDVRERVAACERLYAGAGLPPMFKVTPASAPAGVESALRDAGYAATPGAHVQAASVSPAWAALRGADRSWDVPDEAWVTSYAGFRSLPPEHDAPLRSILGAIALPAHYAAVTDDAGEIAAVGLAVREGTWAGLFDVIVRPDVRRRGYGRRVVETLLGWSARVGATRVYLQVAEGNAPAITLYESLGFATDYTYQYFKQPVG